MNRILFLYHGPHLVHVIFARSLDADFLSIYDVKTLSG